MIALEELRVYTTELVGPVPDDATAEECLDKISNHVGWLTNVWQACHNRHVALEQPVLVVLDPTPAENALATSLGLSEGHTVGGPPACAGSPNRKELG